MYNAGMPSFVKQKMASFVKQKMASSSIFFVQLETKGHFMESVPPDILQRHYPQKILYYAIQVVNLLKIVPKENMLLSKMLL
jgi:hypothetical protein